MPRELLYVDQTLFTNQQAKPEAVAPVEEEAPSALNVAAAAIRQNSVVHSLYDMASRGLVRGKSPEPEPVAGYDAFNDIAGYEEYALRFMDSDNPIRTRAIKDRIDEEKSDRDILRRAGGWGLTASIASGVLDPLTLASMAIPVAPELAAASRIARISAGIGAQVAVDSASEAVLHANQELRTIKDSAINVGFGALFTGALGTIATRIPKGDFEAMRKEALEIAQREREADSTVGAASVKAVTTLEDEGIAKGGQTIAKYMGWASPLTRVLRSPVKESRQLVQRLSDVPYLLGKHLKGIAGPQSLEGAVKRYINVGRWQATHGLDNAFAEYLQSGGSMSRKKFSEEVSRAISRGGVSDVPQAAKMAQWAASQFDADRKVLQELGVSIDDHVLGAKGYFPRVYDFAKIIKNRGAFEETLYRWFKSNPKVPEAGDVVDEVKRRLDNLIERRNDLRRQGLSDDAAPAVDLDHEIEAARKAVASKRQKLDAIAQGGTTTRAEANRILAEAEAESAAKDVEQQLVETTSVKEASEQAVKVARRGQRDVSRLRRKANVLASRIRMLSRRVAELDLEKGKPGLADVEEQLKSALSELTVARQAHREAVQAAKGTKGPARAAALKRVAEARAVRDSAGEKVFGLRTDRKVLSLQENPMSVYGRLDRRLVALREKLDKTTLSAVDARAVSHQLRQIARGVLKNFRAQEAKLAKLKDAAKEAKDLAKKAEPRQLEDAEIREQVQNVIDHLLGMPSSAADIKLRSSAVPLKSRVLDVPDDVLEPFMVRDFETVMSGYLRSMAPEIEFRRAFGSMDMKNELDDINNAYRIKMEAAKTAEGKEKLRKARDKDLEDLMLLRDRLQGNRGPRAGQQLGWIRAARVARLYNYTRLLGGQMLSSLPDYGRLITRYGIPKTLGRTAQFLTNWNLNKLIREDAHKVGTALEMAVDTRTAQMADIADELPATAFDQTMNKIGNTFSRVTLMSPWNASLKTMASALEQDELYRQLKKGTFTTMQTAQLARAGIGKEDMAKIVNMYERHGENMDGLWRARTELWEDQRLARLVEDSILRVADEIIVTRGVGDLPAMMDSELIKTLLQFKTFAIASVNRTMIPIAQGLALADGKTAQGLASMMALGTATYYAKEFAAGRQPDTSPARLAAESLNWSGTLGFLPELWDPIAGLNENLPRFSRFQSRSPTESLLGPTFGTTIDTTYGTVAGMLDGEIEQKDVSRMRRLLPFQSLFYTRRLFNAIEGETGEAIGAKNATSQSFSERVLEETPTK